MVLAGESQSSREFVLEPRQPGDPPPEEAAPFSARKHIVADLDFRALAVPEALDWIAELSGARIRVRPGADVSERVLTLDVSGQPLSIGMKILAGFLGLQFDEETGEIYEGN